MNDNNEIRVLFVVDGMPSGGTERQIVEILKGIRYTCPHVYTLLCVLVKGGQREKEAYRFVDEIVHVTQSSQYDVTLAWSLIRIVRNKRVNILHTFGSISDLSGAVAAKLTGVKLINGSIRNARRVLTLRDRLSKFAMGFADEIVANSSAGLVAYRMNEKENIRVIYNGVDFSRFEKILSFQHSRPYICMVGNFTPKKDQRALIRAFSKVIVQYPSYDLILVGRGREELICRDLAIELGLSGKVIFINDCNAPESYIMGAEVCVLLSPDGEGLSNVIIEYCACSKPVIATNLGGNSEIVENGKTGLLLGTNCPEEVCHAIVDLLRHKGKSRRYGALGREKVISQFTLERMIAAYVSLYREVVDEQFLFNEKVY